MKMNEKFVVFQNKKGEFLTEYKNRRGVLVYEACFVDDINQALYLPIKHYQDQQNKIDLLAELLGCDVVIVKADYHLKFMDGEEVPEPCKDEYVPGSLLGDLFRAMKEDL